MKWNEKMQKMQKERKIKERTGQEVKGMRKKK